MVIQVKINSKNLLLNDWEQINNNGNWNSRNWVRRLIPDDGFSCILLMVSWAREIEKYSYDRFHWAPSFLGDLYDLSNIYYNSFYLQNPPIYRNGQIEEAKKHLDDFIKRFNLLKAFL